MTPTSEMKRCTHVGVLTVFDFLQLPNVKGQPMTKACLEGLVRMEAQGKFGKCSGRCKRERVIVH